MVEKKKSVLYHYPCHDCVFAALAAHLYFSANSIPSLFFPNTVYSPITISQLPLHEISHLYLLDFTGPPGFAQQSLRPTHIVPTSAHKTHHQVQYSTYNPTSDPMSEVYCSLTLKVSIEKLSSFT
ncbi:hypothetical protein YC2023_076726 [Brassica napus]